MIDRDIEAFVAASAAFFPPSDGPRTIAEQRRLYDAYAAACTPARPEGVVVEEGAIAGRGGAVPLRLYRPAAGGHGAVVYLHGGGFVLGGLDSHEFVTARLARDVGAAVVAVDYRLAPEHRSPAAFEDCLAATEAAIEGRLPFEGVGGPIALAGDSAGATLAAAVALAVRDRRVSPIAALALVYPMLAPEPTPPAAETEAEAPMLTTAEVLAYRDAYLGGRTPGPYDFPLLADRFDGLPPALLLPVEHDPLRDDAALFAGRVRAAGGVAEVHLGAGLVHGCLRAIGRSAAVDALYGRLAGFLGAALAAGGPTGT